MAQRQARTRLRSRFAPGSGGGARWECSCHTLPGERHPLVAGTEDGAGEPEIEILHAYKVREDGGLALPPGVL